SAAARFCAPTASSAGRAGTALVRRRPSSACCADSAASAASRVREPFARAPPPWRRSSRRCSWPEPPSAPRVSSTTMPMARWRPRSARGTSDMATTEGRRINELLAQKAQKELLRFSTVGSVDDGKSTLIGRLLHDTKAIYEDHLAALRSDSARVGSGPEIDFALLTDGLKAEREQKITIDVAYRYFSTPRRHFIIADTPGHEQYTRNMATGASTANVAIILIDARHGILTQTKRHSFIAALLGIPRLLIAVNKMDLVDYSQDVFDRVVADYKDFATRLGILDVNFIPISALKGDNVVERSENMLWYRGQAVLEYLENVYIGSDRNLVDFRLPIQ